MKRTYPRRGDLFYCDLNPVVGSEQGGVRPVLIVQNNVGNAKADTTLIAPITTKDKPGIPTHVTIGTDKYGLSPGSVIMTEQIRAIDQSRLREPIGSLPSSLMRRAISPAIARAFGLDEGRNPVGTV